MDHQGPLGYEISMADIEAYLATKQDNEIIGVCMNSDACLAHNTLVWKYGLASSEVLALNYSAWITVSDEGLKFPDDVVHAVSIFDNLKACNSTVTKAEFLDAVKEGVADHA